MSDIDPKCADRCTHGACSPGKRNGLCDGCCWCLGLTVCAEALKAAQAAARCGDVYDPDGRPDDPPCRLPAGHDGWHSDGVGGMWEA